MLLFPLNQSSVLNDIIHLKIALIHYNLSKLQNLYSKNKIKKNFELKIAAEDQKCATPMN